MVVANERVSSDGRKPAVVNPISEGGCGGGLRHCYCGFGAVDEEGSSGSVTNGMPDDLVGRKWYKNVDLEGTL